MTNKFRIIKVVKGDPSIWTNVHYCIERKTFFGFWVRLHFWVPDDLKFIEHQYFSEQAAMEGIITNYGTPKINYEVVVKTVEL